MPFHFPQSAGLLYLSLLSGFFCDFPAGQHGSSSSLSLSLSPSLSSPSLSKAAPEGRAQPDLSVCESKFSTFSRSAGTLFLEPLRTAACATPRWGQRRLPTPCASTWHPGNLPLKSEMCMLEGSLALAPSNKTTRLCPVCVWASGRHQQNAGAWKPARNQGSHFDQYFVPTAYACSATDAGAGASLQGQEKAPQLSNLVHSGRGHAS